MGWADIRRRVTVAGGTSAPFPCPTHEICGLTPLWPYHCRGAADTMERGTPSCARANGRPSESVPGRAAWDVAMPESQGATRRFHRPMARRAGAVVAGLWSWPGRRPCSTRRRRSSAARPRAHTLSCSDSWVGGGASGDWDSAANWSTGVPNGAAVSVCITGNAARDAHRASSSIGELTVSRRQQPHHRGRRHGGPTRPHGGAELEHLVRPAEQRLADRGHDRDVRPPRVCR